MKALILEEMIHPEVAEILPKVEIAVVPVGSCEQHGPNTTYTTDTARAYAFCKLLGEHYGEKLLICPPVTYGISTHHMAFAGTVTLRPETYIEVLKDIAVALHKHGIPRILFVNGHGGNSSALNVAINSLKYSFGIDAYYTGMGFGLFDEAVTPEMGWTEKRGHASESETSQCLALCPEVVRKDNLQKGDVVENFIIRGKNTPFRHGGIAFQWERDASRNGALGDARLSSEEAGRRLNQVALEKVEKMIDFILEHY
ncbi:MAG: creatininase family protein [Clostridia bacterium]|nr:creatininase family protein [Clostridia bacterium]